MPRSIRTKTAQPAEHANHTSPRTHWEHGALCETFNAGFVWIVDTPQLVKTGCGTPERGDVISVDAGPRSYEVCEDRQRRMTVFLTTANPLVRQVELPVAMTPHVTSQQSIDGRTWWPRIADWRERPPQRRRPMVQTARSGVPRRGITPPHPPHPNHWRP